MHDRDDSTPTEPAPQADNFTGSAIPGGQCPDDFAHEILGAIARLPPPDQRLGLRRAVRWSSEMWRNTTGLHHRQWEHVEAMLLGVALWLGVAS